jgi:hypothetical protein
MDESIYLILYFFLFIYSICKCHSTYYRIHFYFMSKYMCWLCYPAPLIHICRLLRIVVHLPSPSFLSSICIACSYRFHSCIFSSFFITMSVVFKFNKAFSLKSRFATSIIVLVKYNYHLIRSFLLAHN